MGNQSKPEAKWQIAVPAEVELVRSIQGAWADKAQWIAIVEASGQEVRITARYVRSRSCRSGRSGIDIAGECVRALEVQVLDASD